MDYFLDSKSCVYTKLCISFFLFAIVNGIGHPTTAISQTTNYPTNSTWQVHAPGGETRCADGSEFKFFSREGNPEKLMIYFTGGGACWKGEHCDTSVNPTPYGYNINENDNPENFQGIFDFQRSENPFKEYTILVAPTCTGDVVLGDSVATYLYETKEGKQKTYTTHHKGYENGIATLQWAFEHVKEPELIVINGSSAGAVATPYYANIVANHYPNTRVVGIGDGAGAYRKSAMKGANFKPWNAKSPYENQPAFENLDPENIGVEQLYIAAAEQNLSNLELYQFDQAYDNAQGYFLSLAGYENPDVLNLVLENREEIKKHDPDFHGYIAGGVEHTVFSRPFYYHYQSNGKPLNDWIADILNNEEVKSYQCRDCTRPELQYAEADLKIIDRIKEYLSSEENWNPKDEYREDHNCLKHTDTYSLRCAVKKAAGGEDAVENYALSLAILYASRERLEDQTLQRSNAPAFVIFNNQSGRTYRDIIDLVEEVERDIQAQLNN